MVPSPVPLSKQLKAPIERGPDKIVEIAGGSVDMPHIRREQEVMRHVRYGSPAREKTIL
jgi:hypothetical protein